MLVGLALMAVPLLVAILTAVLQIRDLADTGQKIVIQGVTGARASQALFGQIASLERTARLYEVLNDPKLIDVYRAQDERLRTTREQLHAQAGTEARQTLDELGTLQASIAALVMSTPAAGGPTAA
jgi:two-component system, NtrC family, sensor histidine kinase GlrK